MKTNTNRKADPLRSFPFRRSWWFVLAGHSLHFGRVQAEEEERRRRGRRESGEQGVQKTIGYFPEEGKEEVEERLKISLGCYYFLKLVPWT